MHFTRFLLPWLTFRQSVECNSHVKTWTEVKRENKEGGGEEKERETACNQPHKIFETPASGRGKYRS